MIKYNYRGRYENKLIHCSIDLIIAAKKNVMRKGKILKIMELVWGCGMFLKIIFIYFLIGWVGM